MYEGPAFQRILLNLLHYLRSPTRQENFFTKLAVDIFKEAVRLKKFLIQAVNLVEKQQDLSDILSQIDKEVKSFSRTHTLQNILDGKGYCSNFNII